MPDKSHAKMSLGDALREKATERPAFSNEAAIMWELIPEGIRPYHRQAVDCLGNAPEFDRPCHNKLVWVIETEDGHYPTCLTHSGMVLNRLLVKYSHDSEVAMYFHPYKGE